MNILRRITSMRSEIFKILNNKTSEGVKVGDSQQVQEAIIKASVEAIIKARQQALKKWLSQKALQSRVQELRRLELPDATFVLTAISIGIALETYHETVYGRITSQASNEKWQQEIRGHWELKRTEKKEWEDEVRSRRVEKKNKEALEENKVLIPVAKLSTGEGPGLYYDIGRKATDLLYKDYQAGQKFSLTTLTSTGVAEVTSTGVNKIGLFRADVNSQMKKENVTTQVTINTESEISAAVTIDELARGLKGICEVVVSDQRSGTVKLQYENVHCGITANVGLSANPILNFSGVVGTPLVALGVDLSFDTATGDLSKCDAGFSFSNTEVIAAVTLNDKGENVNASYYVVSPSTSTAFGAELSHSLSTNENKLTIGAEQVLGPSTSVKAKIDNHGKAGCLMQHEWRPKSLFTISGEVDTRANEKGVKVGLSLSLKP